MTVWLIYAGLGALTIYQLYVTIKVLASVQYSRRQKLAQVILVWLLPFIGAVLCHVFLVSDTQGPGEKDAAFTPDGGNSPVGIGSDGVQH